MIHTLTRRIEAIKSTWHSEEGSNLSGEAATAVQVINGLRSSATKSGTTLTITIMTGSNILVGG